MTIPKEIIEKAIEGGFKVKTFYKGLSHKEGTAPSATNDTDSRSETLYMIDSIALDPLFWQALGKALGWEQWLPTGFHDKYEDDIEELGWKVQAMRFYDLILTGQPTEEFFATLLK